MAGGKSSRMGTDKGLLEFDGRPLVQYGIYLLLGCFPEIYISTNHADYEQFNLPIIPDIHRKCGPMGGLHAVLSTIKTDYCFIISCDMPFVEWPILNKILKNCNDFQITIPRIGEQIEPLCAVYAKNLLPEVEKRIETGNFKMHDLIRNAKTNYIDFDSSEPFFNFNTMEEFRSRQ